MTPFALAIKNASEFGCTDIFPKLPEYKILAKKPLQLESLVTRIAQDYKIHKPQNLHIEVLKNDGSSRQVTLIDPLLNLRYLSIAIKIAEQIEDQRIVKWKNTVHSYRFDPISETGRLFDTDFGYRSFTQTLENRAKEFDGYCISIDIRTFYPSLSYNIIAGILNLQGIESDIIRELIVILRLINGNTNKGLPIGGNASRLIAEAILNEVDLKFVTEGFDFVRFVDDFVFFTEKGDEIFLLEKIYRILRKFGLNINYNKLQICPTQEFDSKFDIFVNLPAYDCEPDVRHIEEVEEILNTQIAQIEHDKHINAGLLRILANDREAFNRCLPSLFLVLGFMKKNFGKVAQIILDNHQKIDRGVIDKLEQAILTLCQKSHSVISSEPNISYSVYLLGICGNPDSINKVKSLYSEHNGVKLLNFSIINVMAQCNQTEWLIAMLPRFNNLNQWERRALIMGLRGKHSLNSFQLYDIEKLLIE